MTRFSFTKLGILILGVVVVVSLAIKNPIVGTALEIKLHGYSEVFNEVCKEEEDDIKKRSYVLGRYAYKLQKQGEKIEIPEVFSKCDLGFYEGVYAAYVSEEDVNPEDIRNFCSYVEESISRKGFNWCYISFGASLFYSKASHKESKEEISRIVDQNVSLCNIVGREELQKTGCKSGVFNGLGRYILEREDTFSQEDLLLICNSQKSQDYRIKCFRGLVSILYPLTDRDISKALELIDKIDNHESRYEARLTFFSSLANESISRDQVKKICLALDGETKNICIKGYATGLVELGTAGKEEIDIVDFCTSSEFSNEQIVGCLKRSFIDLQQARGPATKDICLSSVPVKFQEACVF